MDDINQFKDMIDKLLDVEDRDQAAIDFRDWLVVKGYEKQCADNIATIFHQQNIEEICDIAIRDQVLGSLLFEYVRL